MIEIDYAFRSDIDDLESIDFDIIFSKRINRIGKNYDPANIINELYQSSVTDDLLEDFFLCLEYEVNDSQGYT